MTDKTFDVDTGASAERSADRVKWPIDLNAYDALLFDLDGTLVDTMALHYRAYAQVFAGRGLYLRQQDYMSCIGAPATQAIPLFCKAAGMLDILPEEVKHIHQEKKALFGDLLRTAVPPLLPAASLLNTVRQGQRRALVSSGNSEGVHQIIAAAGWQTTFDCIISGDDVTHGKPNPEPYLTAARQLAVPSERCVVFEDTQAGIDAGVAAGMTVIDVSGELPFVVISANI